ERDVNQPDGGEAQDEKAEPPRSERREQAGTERNSQHGRDDRQRLGLRDVDLQVDERLVQESRRDEPWRKQRGDDAGSVTSILPLPHRVISRQLSSSTRSRRPKSAPMRRTYDRRR